MEASDNVMVTKVQIEIVDAEGKVLEQGEAGRWTQTGGNMLRAQMERSRQRPGIWPEIRRSRLYSNEFKNTPAPLISGFLSTFVKKN